MEFPPDWVIHEAQDFEVTGPMEPGDLTAELMVQVRPNGRFLDNFRVAVGGAQFLQAEFTTATIFSNALLPATALVLHKRPIDIVIRKNLTTSDWLDVIGLLRSRDLIYKKI
jgi:hypothetical protein